MTRLLLERGADPNEEETPYHAPESYDNAALKVLVESGKLNADSLTTMLLRKADIHDYEGMKYLLEHGADPNRMTRWHTRRCNRRCGGTIALSSSICCWTMAPIRREEE